MKETIFSIINFHCNYLQLSSPEIIIDNYEIFCTFIIDPNENDTFIREKQILIEQIKTLYPNYNVYVSAIKNPASFVDNKTSIKKSFPNIKKIIAVASGKGGVGKSTIAINIAFALESLNKKVGILDGDIYGPSIDASLQGNIVHHTSSSFPVYAKNNIKYVSVANFLKEKDSPIIMKTPMIVKLFNQMLNDTPWDHLDYLIIDLPAGTGDLHINLISKYDINGTIIVCTPQKIALIDSIKAINMFKKLQTPILGIIENMSSFICPNCSKISYIFSSQGVKNVAEEHNLSILNSIPIDIKLREYLDDGKNYIELHPESSIANIFKNIVNKIL